MSGRATSPSLFPPPPPYNASHGPQSPYHKLSVNDGSSDEGTVFSHQQLSRSETRKIQKLQYAAGYYDGQVVNGKRDGEGVMYENNKNTYQGSWKQNQKHGQGVFTDGETGEVYDGKWFEDERHGGCTIKARDGTILFDGTYEHDQPANGEMFVPDVGTYSGQWQQGLFYSGTFTDQSGERHQFSEGRRLEVSQGSCCTIL